MKKIQICFCIYFIFSIIILYTFYSCEKDIITNESIVEFPDSISTIFNSLLGTTNQTCVSPICHSTNDRASGFDLENWTNAMNGSDNGTMIIPYNAFWSYLIAAVNNDTNVAPVILLNPPVLSNLHKLSGDKVHTIMHWINNGAKNKNGGVAFEVFQPKAYITNKASDYVALIHTEYQLVARLIPVGGSSQNDAPYCVTIDHLKKYFYVSLIQEGYIEKYNMLSNTRVARMPAGNNPAQIVISPDNFYGYISNYENGLNTERSIRKFQTSMMTVLDTITDQLLNAPNGMALSNDGQFLYVASQQGEYLFKIETNSFKIILKIPIDPSVPPTGNGTGNYLPFQVELSPDNSFLSVTCTGPPDNQAPDFVKVFNSNDLSLTKNITVEDNPLLLKFTPDGRYVYVCNRNSNSVSVISAISQTVIRTIQGVGIQPHGIDFIRDGKYAIVSCESQSGYNGHHPQVGSVKLGVSRIIRTIDFTVLNKRYETASFPTGIVVAR
ncbi:MAG: hypothetical protein ISS16_04945 [Ignavibacteria bacterium]|nr:hypothetical protein [Ignavibacteria bacterium]